MKSNLPEPAKPIPPVRENSAEANQKRKKQLMDERGRRGMASTMPNLMAGATPSGGYRASNQLGN